MFKYLGTALTNQNSIEIMGNFNVENACYI